jgi:hypothetical protein
MRGRASLWVVYHLELRQFPHNMSRFNLSEQELHALLAPWVRDKPIELGERKWSPHQAKLTVLEGPRLEVQQLSMGRGWRAAERESEDVTAQVIAAIAEEAQAAAAAGMAMPAGTASPAAPLQQEPGGSRTEAVAPADPLAVGLQLAALLGDDPAALLSAWRQAAAQSPELAPSEALARAEEGLRSSRAQSG